MGNDKERELQMNRLEEAIECNINLIAITGIEDKLQDEVASVISDLKLGGISLWVLTGDKIETAINIAYSCQLLDDNVQ